MSRQQSRRVPGATGLGARSNRTPLATIPETSVAPRRPSISISPGANPSVPTSLNAGPKAQRTSKTSQKLVVLPSAPQTRPLPGELADERERGPGESRLAEDEEDTESVLVSLQGARDRKSAGERMSKVERQRAGFKRLTAYCVAEGFSMKLLAAFLKREHNVTPRVYDEAMYAIYHLPLLPGYAPNVNVRSSAASKSPSGKSLVSRLFEAEENGYEGTYFTPEYTTEAFSSDGFIPSPHEFQQQRAAEEQPELRDQRVKARRIVEENVAEVIFFAYGVVVFFGLQEAQERSIIDDIESADVLNRRIDDDSWEIEQCHYAYDPNAAYPRIYNDLFTFKSPSHLLKLSIAHALAQSTLLARYESKAQLVLSDPRTVAIPRTLARTGELRLRRRDALRLTGRLFQLRRDVNLVSNVLDVPELFWSEASLKDLYDAVREYMEISPRVQVLNERLAVTSDLLDLIHGHLNNSAMERITWIIIWLIVVACVVELGEVVARLVVHATTVGRDVGPMPPRPSLSREQVFGVLKNMMRPNVSP